jgi:predicted Zn-dependent protease
VSLVVLGSLDLAEAVFVAVAEVATGTAERAHAAFGLGQVLRRRGIDHAAAVRALRDACALEPSSSLYWAGLAAAAEALARRGASGRADKRKVDVPGLWQDASAAYSRVMPPLNPPFWG